MAYTLTFSASGQTSLSVEKSSRAKIVNEALKTAGITAVITVNKTVDFNTKKELTEKQKKAIADRKAKRAADKAAAEKTANKNKK